MREFRLGILLPLFFIFPLLAAAQQTSVGSPTRDAQAVTILRQSFVAMGGVAGRHISDATLSGQVTQLQAVGDVQGTISYKYNGPERCRVDKQIGDDSISRIVNGSEGRRTQAGKNYQLPQHAQINHDLKYIPVLFEMSQIDDPLLQIQYIGSEILNGQSVHHIHLEKVYPGRTPQDSEILAKLTAIEFYVDAQSLVLVKRTQIVSSFQNIGNSVQIDQYFQDYRLDGGILVPHTVSVFAGNLRIEEIKFDSVVFNSGVSSSTFEVRQ